MSTGKLVLAISLFLIGLYLLFSAMCRLAQMEVEKEESEKKCECVCICETEGRKFEPREEVILPENFKGNPRIAR